MMLLRDFLEEYDMTKTEFADSIGYSLNHLSHVMYGTARITPRFMAAVTYFTDEEISYEDLVEEIKLNMGPELTPEQELLLAAPRKRAEIRKIQDQKIKKMELERMEKIKNKNNGWV